MKDQILHKKQYFANIRELVEWAADTHGEAIAYSYRPNPHKSEVVSHSFLALRDDVRALGAKLTAMGIHGKHCTLIGKFSYEWVLTYFAVLSVGGVLVPLDRDWGAEDLADTVKKADAEFLFADEDLAEKVSVIEKSVHLAAKPFLLQAKTEGNSLAALISSGKEAFLSHPESYFEARLSPDKMSLLVFTSGTTGKGKGVMLSQNNILSDLTDVIPYIDFGKKTVGVLPPHHTYGSSVMIVGHAIIGAEVYISAGIRYVTKELKEQKPQHLVLVPLYLETFYRKIRATLKEQGKTELVERMIKLSAGMRRVGIDARRRLFSAIRAAFGGEVKTIISGGAPINPEILAFFEAIGITTLNGYGITECAPIVAVNRSLNPVEGSVGNVLHVNAVKISHPNEDDEGEICVKGENVMLGYYRDDAATEEAFDSDGYFRTGDYGRLTEEGILYITGRKKNLIILSNGKNVYPEEIENALIATPGVIDVVVYEGKSKRGMENNAIVAEIYPDNDFFEKNAIEDKYAHFKAYIDAYNKTAVPYKKVGLLRVREEEFPKNTLRKIMRFKINTEID